MSSMPIAKTIVKKKKDLAFCSLRGSECLVEVKRKKKKQNKVDRNGAAHPMVMVIK